MEYKTEAQISQLKEAASPALKWVGGKRQLLPTLRAMMPKKYGRYIDPFMGAMAVPLNLVPAKAILSDANEELVITHCEIRDNVEGVISQLERHIDDKDYYDALRATGWQSLSRPEVAARMIYLNKSCFNGLYRINKKGLFNASYGKPPVKGRTVCNPDNLRQVSQALQGFEIINQDFRKTLKHAKANDVVFLDPPYHETFTSYTAAGFSEDDQRFLASEFKRLDQLGCHVIATNSNHEFIHRIYSGYSIEVVNVRRNINCDKSGRTGKEVIISNRKKAVANDELVLAMAA